MNVQEVCDDLILEGTEYIIDCIVGLCNLGLILLAVVCLPIVAVGRTVKSIRRHT